MDVVDCDAESLLCSGELPSPTLDVAESRFHQAQHDSRSVASRSLPNGGGKVSAERLPDDIGKRRVLGTRGGAQLFERSSVEAHDDAMHAHVGLALPRAARGKALAGPEGGCKATSSGRPS